MFYGTQRGEYTNEDLKSVRGVAVNQRHQPYSWAALAGTDFQDNLLSFYGLPLDLSHGTSQV